MLKHPYGDSVRARPDYAMLAMLFGCGFRRSELAGLEVDEIQMRQGHWAVVDLVGKGGHIRTVPITELGQSGPRPMDTGTETPMAKRKSESLAGTERLMEEVCELENCKQAFPVRQAPSW